MSENLGSIHSDREDIPPELLDMEEFSEQFLLPCCCKDCGFSAAFRYEEGGREIAEGIAQAEHDQEFPNCGRKILF